MDDWSSASLPRELLSSFSRIKGVSVPKGSSVEDQPLCVAFDVKSVLVACTSLSKMQMERIPSLIASCIVSSLDMSSGEHGSRALSCVRVTQMQQVKNSSTAPRDAEAVSMVMPRLLRYHFPYLAVHPYEKMHMLSIVASRMNDAEIFGVRNWHAHMHSMTESEDSIPLECFDWVNVSRPVLYTFSIIQDGDCYDCRPHHAGFPTEDLLEELFPSYIHSSCSKVRTAISCLCDRDTFDHMRVLLDNQHDIRDTCCWKQLMIVFLKVVFSF